MKKQIKFKTYLVGSLLLFSTACTKPNVKNIGISLNLQQDTLKNSNQQFQKIDQLNQKVDSVKLKWDAIEKALKEKQQNPPH